jgi:hypothetical protein
MRTAASDRVARKVPLRTATVNTSATAREERKAVTAMNSASRIDKKRGRPASATKKAQVGSSPKKGAGKTTVSITSKRERKSTEATAGVKGKTKAVS